MDFNIDDRIVSESVRRSIKELIREELSISNDVSKKSIEIIDLIQNDYKNRERVEIADGVYERKGSVECDMFGKTFTINYTHFNFRDYDTYDEQWRLFRNDNTSSYIDGEIRVSILAISGEIQPNTLDDSVQHEVEHMYQTFMRGKELYTSKSMYNKFLVVKSQLDKGLDDCGGFLPKLCDVIYYTNKNEHDAFVNGLYAQLIKTHTLYHKRTMEASDAYKVVTYLKQLEEFLGGEIDNKHFGDAATHFGKSKEWFIQRCSIGRDYLMKRIMKIMVKGMKDRRMLDEDKHIMINISPFPYEPFRKYKGINEG